LDGVKNPKYINMPFSETNKKIEQFLDENDLYPMHLEMYLDEVCNIVCRSKQEDDEITDELDRLRSE